MRASSAAMRSLAASSGGHWGRDLDLSAGGLVGDLLAVAAVVAVLNREEERLRDVSVGVGLRLIFCLEMELPSAV